MGQETQQPSRSRRWMRRAILAATIAGTGVALVIGWGFIWFAGQVATTEVALDRRADGIVVLTGGASRIADAMELLAAGRGQRLFITGVNRATSSSEISRLMPTYERLIACCVDLDHRALDTVGNAVETRRWATSRGFRSLIVVTSSYHMPRAMSELAEAMPEVTLIAYPVVTDKIRVESWWTSASTAKLLFSEYLKYIVAQVRMRLRSAA